NDGCHLLFIQCDECASAMENCCSNECLETTRLPLVEQIKLRKGIQNGNMIFKKGKSKALKFKHSGELSDVVLAKAKPEVKETNKPKSTVKKVLVGKGEHYYAKSNVGLFILTNKEIETGDTLLISGPTTGEHQFTLEKMLVNGKENSIAKKDDKVTFEFPVKIRKSDKLYKVIEKTN